MKRVLIILLFTALISQNCEQTTATQEQTGGEAPPKMVVGKMVCLGDGFTAGVGEVPGKAYPAVLQNLLTSNGHNIKVVNAGIKGESVQMANERVEWILQQRLSSILFALGCQEIQLKLKTEQVYKEWSLLLTKVRRAYPDIPIFITTPCIEDGIYTKPDFYIPLAEQFDITFIPLDISTTKDWWLPDSEYLNAKGQAALASQIQKVVEPVITSTK